MFSSSLHKSFLESALAARTPLCLRDQAIRLVIAYLLNTDVSSQCEIVGTQRETSCHVKLPSAFRDFFQSTRFFLPHRTSTLSLKRSLMSPYIRVSMLLHPPVGHGCCTVEG